MKIDIMGVQVDNVTKQEALERMLGFVRSGTPHYAVTVYSEFVVEAQKNLSYRQVLNSAHLSLPDGISILWAASFLALPKADPVGTFFHWLGTLASIILSPKSVRTVIKEKVSGSRLAWDIAAMAEKEELSLALVGGTDGVAERTADRLKAKFPGLKINLAVSDRPFDHAMVQTIAASNSDILMVAFQPPKQEFWIAENIQHLNVKLAIGLGGTFDYISGKRLQPPEWAHGMGLEWFWRLVTQPERLGRMWRAVPVFSYLILQYKLKQ